MVRVWDLESGEELGPGGARRIADRSVSPDSASGEDGPGAEAAPGARQFRKCAVCHSVTEDGGRRAGPTLHGVFGRRAGSVAGYNYSRALRESRLIWTEETIDALFAQGPHTYTPGSKMPLQRMPESRDRAELIAYLKRVTTR